MTKMPDLIECNVNFGSTTAVAYSGLKFFLLHAQMLGRPGLSGGLLLGGFRLRARSFSCSLSSRSRSFSWLREQPLLLAELPLACLLQLALLADA